MTIIIINVGPKEVFQILVCMYILCQNDMVKDLALEYDHKAIGGKVYRRNLTYAERQDGV